MVLKARVRALTPNRTRELLIGAAVVVLLMAGWLAHLNSSRVTRVGEDAIALQWIDSTMLVVSHIHTNLPQAVTFARLERDGLVDAEDAHRALTQLTETHARLGDLFAVGEGYDSYPALARYLEPVSAAVTALHNGDVTAATDALSTRFETAYVELTASLDAERATFEASFVAQTTRGPVLTGWIVLVVIIAIPAAGVAAYLLIVRREAEGAEGRRRTRPDDQDRASRAKDAFIAVLSHQLRTPLTSIYGFARVLADGGANEVGGVQETAEIIATEAAEMTRMVDDLRVATRLENAGLDVDPIRTNVGQVVETAVAPFRSAGLDVRWEPITAFAVTDAGVLRHVIVNLLSNAARHGGPSVGIVVTAGDGTVAVEVWDNGPGVPGGIADRWAPDLASEDVELFAGRMGLGLAVASRLTRLIGGSLEYQRFEGRSFFVVTLPAAVADEGESHEEPESVAEKIRALAS